MYLAATLVVLTRLVCVESRGLPRNYLTQFQNEKSETTPRSPVFNYEVSSDTILTADEYDGGQRYSIKSKEDGHSYNYNNEILFQQQKEPCSIVVISNIQTPTMQSLLRKYKYDANGDLIPSSVQYFMKIPQKGEPGPILVPFNDKSFSHLGGYMRYYKEVPPIPQSW